MPAEDTSQAVPAARPAQPATLPLHPLGAQLGSFPGDVKARKGWGPKEGPESWWRGEKEEAGLKGLWGTQEETQGQGGGRSPE